MTYPIQSIVGMGIAFFLYQLFLKKEKYFILNRYFLIAAVLLCSLAPIIPLSTSGPLSIIPELDINNMLSDTTIYEDSLDGNTLEFVEGRTNILLQSTLFLYLLVSCILLIRLGRNLLFILRLLNNRGPRVNGLQTILVKEKTNPFSFFNFLFINAEALNDKTLSDTIIEHEKCHSRQYHSLDILLIEMACSIFWFNPFVWLFRKEISVNHEYLADESVMKAGFDMEEYTATIIRSVKNTFPIYLASNFSFLKTKNRLLMIHKLKSSALAGGLKISAALILLSAALALFSFKNEGNSPFVVIIDAGHGGKDNGTTHSNLIEKNLNLAICRKLEALNKDEGLKIIPTRTDDEFIKLADRAKLAGDNHADLFISIHINSAKNQEMNGIEANYYKDGQYSDQSHEFSKALVQSFEEGGKIRTMNSLVLRDADCPGILLQLGFLSNENDRLKLVDPDYQNQLANAIYEGIIRIRP